MIYLVHYDELNIVDVGFAMFVSSYNLVNAIGLFKTRQKKICTTRSEATTQKLAQTLDPIPMFKHCETRVIPPCLVAGAMPRNSMIPHSAPCMIRRTCNRVVQERRPGPMAIMLSYNSLVGTRSVDRGVDRLRIPEVHQRAAGGRASGSAIL